MKKIFGLLLCFSIVACSSGGIRSGGGAGGSLLSPYKEVTLSNGLRVLLVEDKSLPYVSYSMVIRGGAAADPQDKKGLSHFVASLLEKGAGKRNAVQIADDFGLLGTDFSVTADEDYIMLGTSGLALNRDQLLALYAEVITSATFNAAEVERLRRHVQAELMKLKDDPDSVASLAFKSFLFGQKHPYAHSILGTSKDIGRIRRKDIILHYLKYYRPNNAILAVVGQYGEDIVTKLEESFKDWKPRELSPVEFPPIPEISSRQMQFIEKSNLAQTQIVLGHAGIDRKNPDYLTLKVINTILGSGFSSRLVNQIRDNLGLTYSINSSFEGRLGEGPFTVATFTRNDKVGQTVKETLNLLSQFSEKGVTEEELEDAKSSLWGMYLRSISTPERLALNLLILRIYEIPDTYLTNYRQNLNRISLKDANAVIKKYVRPNKLKMVVHSTSSVLPQLQGVAEISKRSLRDLE